MRWMDVLKYLPLPNVGVLVCWYVPPLVAFTIYNILKGNRLASAASWIAAVVLMHDGLGVFVQIRQYHAFMQNPNLPRDAYPQTPVEYQIFAAIGVVVVLMMIILLLNAPHTFERDVVCVALVASVFLGISCFARGLGYREDNATSGWFGLMDATELLSLCAAIVGFGVAGYGAIHTWRSRRRQFPA